MRDCRYYKLVSEVNEKGEPDKKIGYFFNKDHPLKEIREKKQQLLSDINVVKKIFQDSFYCRKLHFEKEGNSESEKEKKIHEFLEDLIQIITYKEDGIEAESKNESKDESKDEKSEIKSEENNTDDDKKGNWQGLVFLVSCLVQEKVPYLNYILPLIRLDLSLLNEKQLDNKIIDILKKQKLGNDEQMGKVVTDLPLAKGAMNLILFEENENKRRLAKTFFRDFSFAQFWDDQSLLRKIMKNVGDIVIGDALKIF